MFDIICVVSRLSLSCAYMCNRATDCLNDIQTQQKGIVVDAVACFPVFRVSKIRPRFVFVVIIGKITRESSHWVVVFLRCCYCSSGVHAYQYLESHTHTHVIFRDPQHNAMITRAAQQSGTSGSNGEMRRTIPVYDVDEGTAHTRVFQRIDVGMQGGDRVRRGKSKAHSTYEAPTGVCGFQTKHIGAL